MAKKKYDMVKVIPNMTIKEATDEYELTEQMLHMVVSMLEDYSIDPSMSRMYGPKRDLITKKRECDLYMNELKHTIAYLKDKDNGSN